MNLSPGTRNFIIEHEPDDVHALALKAKQFPGIDMQLAIRQIAGRKIAKEKIPSWYADSSIVYPGRLSLEQCSSEQTARFKALLCGGESMVDLTGGFGVDCSFLANRFKNAIYVERQEELAEIAAHNFRLLGQGHIRIVNGDAVGYLSSMAPVNLIYIDPARRDKAGRKVALIEDCTPDILELGSLLEKKSEQTMIKLSPMLDIALAVKTMKSVSDVYVISVNNECRELLFIRKKTRDRIKYHCVNIRNGSADIFSFYKEDEDLVSLCYTDTVGKYLYEPNASVLKGGAYKSIARSYALSKLHPASHLYTSDTLHNDFHGRKFVVDTVCSLSKKELKAHLPGIDRANVTTRNFPLSVQETRKKTGLKDGGEAYVFATTLADNRKVLLICHKA
ncbi:MAG: SAM-dependent methyltransferase [Prevotella sp.]|jgi:16S rRNA G966 N2-methylase RsmD|nr:SAM-dependent methyltransferase [Prevotella sp.]